MLSSKNQNCECIECIFCKITNKPEEDREIKDTLLDQTEHFQWIPGLGAFVEGYSLIISKKHILNTGCLNINVIKELELFISNIKKILNVIYKKDSVVFEHGSTGHYNYAGSCIDHHHIHILPAELKRVPDILTKNFVRHNTISSIEDLIQFNQNQTPYIYIEHIAGEYNVFEAPTLPRQYLRQVLAAECGCLQDWDWREKPFIENIYQFVSKIREIKIQRRKCQT